MGESYNIVLVPYGIEPESSVEEINGRQQLVAGTTSARTLHSPFPARQKPIKI